MYANFKVGAPCVDSNCAVENRSVTKISPIEDNVCNFKEGAASCAFENLSVSEISPMEDNVCNFKEGAASCVDSNCAVENLSLTEISPGEDNVCNFKEGASCVDSSCAVENVSVTEISPIEDNVCNFKEGRSGMVSKCAVENLSVSPQSYQSFSVTTGGSDIPDVIGSDVLVGALNSISIVGSSEQRDNEGAISVAFGNALEAKCNQEISPTPQKRSSYRSRTNKKTLTKKTGGKCRKIVRKKLILDPILLKVAKRRRSFLCKRARSCVWGVLGNITKIFEHNMGLVVNQNVQKKSQRVKGGRGIIKRIKDKAAGCSQRYSEKSRGSLGGIKLKLKLGKVVNQSGLVDMVPVLDSNRDKCLQSGVGSPKLTCISVNKFEEEIPGISGLKTSILDVQLANKEPQCAVVREKLVGETGDENFLISCERGFEGSGVAGDNSFSYAGTSPDSEVINMIPDAQVGEKTPKKFHSVPPFSQASVAPGDVVDMDLPHTGRKKGKKKEKLLRAGNCIVENGSCSPEVIEKAVVVDKCGQGEDIGVASYPSETSISTTITGNVSGNSSSSDGLSGEPLSLSRGNEFGVCSRTSKPDSGKDASLYSRLDVGLESSESQISDKLLCNSKIKGEKLTQGSKPKGVSRGRSEVPHATRNRKGNAGKQKGNSRKPTNKGRTKEKGDFNQIACKMESNVETGFYILDDRQNGTGGRSVSDGMYKSEIVPSGVVEQCLPKSNAWVLCDDCLKWRRIPAMLADSIEETNCRWTCKDNVDKAFADCSTPQEKSNAEINAELEISDASGEEEARDGRFSSKRLGQKHFKDPRKPSWMVIKSNLFLHRRRKTQTIDEVMVCHCKPARDGRKGCGDGCLNRMLNIECVRGTCPCGELCSNQQFQKRKYAQLDWIRCGKKGFGLQLQEDISRGQFLIEYVGEVLDMHAYESRQREYALKGHKHFYFMTLNGSEVIDACAKGNLGRFINHSCDPNCRTEKWMVNGEVCIGLFALRDIKKGEEVTFDYNYVRVFGAAAKKCVCGSSQCRGYLGGDPSNSEVIVQSDSDEEYPEPAMVYEDGEIDDNLGNLIPETNSFDGSATEYARGMVRNNEKLATAVGCFETSTEKQAAESLSKDKDNLDKSSITVGKLESTKEIEKYNSSSSVSQPQLQMEALVGQLPSSLQAAVTSFQLDDVMSKITSVVHQETSTGDEILDKDLCSSQRSETYSMNDVISKSLSDTSDARRKSRYDTAEDGRLAHPVMKTSRSSLVVKKGKPIKNVSKSQVLAQKTHVLLKPKKLVEGSSGGRFEAVEEKLNELLDADGGINKRKDAPKGYLKLLLLTAASGDSGNGEAIQSNRDLSMILDALLKTKSRMVLLDIINKNGLQMLHNIMKRYRRDFNKIPILRKLLKVLEYLAMREILTLDHINGGPRCPGVESFRESMLALTEHDDKQVHQIARNFRDRWIPRNFRRICCMDRDDGRMDINKGSNCHNFSSSHNCWRDRSSRPTDAVECVKQSSVAIVVVDPDISESFSASCSSGRTTNGVRTRKRKSRWDQPADTSPKNPQLKEPKIHSNSLQKTFSSPRNDTEMVLDPVNRLSREGKGSHGSLLSSSQQMADNGADDMREDTDEDAPPGFSSPGNRALVSSGVASSNTDIPGSNDGNARSIPGVVMGYPQERFLSRLPVSFGIPWLVVHQYGTPQPEASEGWAVAPGMPFKPFPPLPPYPRDSGDHPTCAANSITMTQPAEEDLKNNHDPAICYSAQEFPSTSGAGPPDMGTSGPNIPFRQNFQHVRGTPHSLGRRYFRQQKWNSSRTRPPWARNRNGWGPVGNNSTNGMCNLGVGNVANDLNGPYSSEDRSSGAESFCNTFYQQPQQHQN